MSDGPMLVMVLVLVKDRLVMVLVFVKDRLVMVLVLVEDGQGARDQTCLELVDHMTKQFKVKMG